MEVTRSVLPWVVVIEHVIEVVKLGDRSQNQDDMLVISLIWLPKCYGGCPPIQHIT